MKIPPHAEQVFKGVLFDVYQWPQKMFDGSLQIFEALRRRDGVQVIPTMNGKILLAQEEQPNRPPFKGFFGGQMDEGETPLAAAKRELREETGLESDDWEFIKAYSASAKIDWNSHVYVARNCRKAASPQLDAGERIEIRECSFAEFLEVVSAEDFRAIEISRDILRARVYPDRLAVWRKKILGE